MSKSMVVALVALFFSLTGWGAAAKLAMAPPNTVGTQQIVNGSIRLGDLHPSAVKALKGRRGKAGVDGRGGGAGPAGPAGPVGAAGPAGGFNPAKVTYHGAPTTTVPGGAVGNSTISCPAGSVPIGGGGLYGLARVGLSAKSSDGWTVSVFNDTGASTGLSAFVVCAAP